jgi:hypothetical protein
MAATKYGQHVVTMPFKPCGEGGLRQVAIMDGKCLGVDAYVKYGVYWTAGKIGREPYVPHTHDFDQIIIFAGSDMDDIGELGAEIEFCLGEEMETHMITTTTAIAIPKGLPHFPATVNRLDRRFFYIEVSVAPEYSETPVRTEKKPAPPVGWRAETRKYIMPVAFMRKGSWHYGPLNRDDGGGYISFITGNSVDIDFMTIYESMKKAPYRICPDPDKPHTHPTTQIMCFVGTDPDDLTDLGADFEICLGKEEERHVFNKSTAIVTPPFLPHWPGGLLKCERPILMVDIHPFGNQH